MTVQLWYPSGTVLRRRGRADVTPGGGGGGGPVGPGAWPTAATTGPRGALTNSAAASIASGANVSGINYLNYVQITGPATVTDCKFSGGVLFAASSTGSVMDYCESAAGLSISSADNLAIKNTDIYGSDDLIHIASDNPAGNRPTDVLFQNVYAHDPDPPQGAHSDGIQITGGLRITFDNCVVDMGPWRQVGGADVLNAAFFTQASQGLIGDISVLGGYYNGGGITFRYEGTYTGAFKVQNVTIGPGFYADQYDPPQGVGPSLQSGNQRRAGDGTLTPLTFLST